MSDQKKTSILALSLIPALFLAALVLNLSIPAPAPVPSVVAANAH